MAWSCKTVEPHTFFNSLSLPTRSSQVAADQFHTLAAMCSRFDTSFPTWRTNIWRSMAADINENTNLSEYAKKNLKADVLPRYKTKIELCDGKDPYTLKKKMRFFIQHWRLSSSDFSKHIKLFGFANIFLY